MTTTEVTSVIQGQPVTLTSADNPFTDKDGNPITPTAVFLTWWVNDLNPTVITFGVDPDFMNPATGVYEYELDTTDIPVGSTVTATIWSTGIGQAQSNPPVKFDVDGVP